MMKRGLAETREGKTTIRYVTHHVRETIFISNDNQPAADAKEQALEMRARGRKDLEQGDAAEEGQSKPFGKTSCTTNQSNANTMAQTTAITPLERANEGVDSMQHRRHHLRDLGMERRPGSKEDERRTS
eukprot:scaffold25193_cov41-Cyclotella_meneghiniana.AAC.1